MFLVVLGEMGRGGVMGDHIVGEELRAVSITMLTAMLDMTQLP
jgi:hypothetical protein